MVHFQHGVAALPPVTVALPVTMACVLAVAGKRAPRPVVDVVAVATAAGTVALDAVLVAGAAGGRIVTWVGGWFPHHGYSVGIVLVGDPVGTGIALVASSLMTLALLYSARYFESVNAHFQALMLLFLAGMEGFALTGDLFDLFVFFELMGASAFGLTALQMEEPSSLQGALNFGVLNSFGAYASLMGVGILYARTGSVGMPQLHRALLHQRPDALLVGAFVLVMTGFLVKAAVVPFHFWLADAHAVAPPPVCVLFSGVMVPLGVYAVFRVYWVVFSPVLPPGDVGRAMVVLGVLTAVVGAVMCLAQRHIKRLLAYSTIAHVGLFVLGLACLTPAGTAGALVYVAGHAGVKAALFLLAGVMLNRYGTIDEHELWGRGRRHRLMGWLTVLGALGLAALPPFGTGLGKALSESAGTTAGYGWFPALFVAVSAMTGGAVLRVAGRVYFGLGPRPEQHEQRDTSSGGDGEPEFGLQRVPSTMLVPILVLLAGAVAVGVVPGVPEAAARAGAAFVDAAGYTHQALGHLAAPLPATAAHGWDAEGIGLDVLSAVLAVGVAGLGLFGRRLGRPAAVVGDAARAPLRLLHRLHSGHLGDYVVWLLLGMALTGGLVGLPLR